MIGKNILIFVTERKQRVADWIKGEDAQLPTGQIKGVVVELDWQVTCNAHNLSETMAQIEAVVEQLHKDPKVLHIRKETRMLIGEHGANVPVERGKRYHYVCKACGLTKPCSFDRAVRMAKNNRLIICACGKAMEIEVVKNG